MKELIDGRIFWISVCITLIIAVTGIGLLAVYEQMSSFSDIEMDPYTDFKKEEMLCSHS